MNKYNIVKGASHPMYRTTIEEDVLPTPRLLSEGTRGPVEAYREGETDGTTSLTRRVRGIWRMRDDKYDPPGTEYTTVIVEVVEEKNPWD